MIKSYLQLVRIPGIFTAFTNILLGFFIVQHTNINWISLGPLLTTSGFLFLAGMALNDYFDYNIDKKESSNRPLPSGKISRKTALLIGLGSLLFANAAASFVGLESLVVSLIMTILILTYDIKSKKNIALGIINLSSIRFLNVILGATVIAFTSEVIWFAVPIAIFVAGISILAKTERSYSSKTIENLNIIFIVAAIFYTIIITFDGKFVHYVFLGIFIFAVFIPNFIFKARTSKNIQKRITFQLLAITILDAILISAFSDLIYAILASMLYLPAFLILRKMYLT